MVCHGGSSSASGPLAGVFTDDLVSLDLHNELEQVQWPTPLAPRPSLACSSALEFFSVSLSLNPRILARFSMQG